MRKLAVIYFAIMSLLASTLLIAHAIEPQTQSDIEGQFVTSATNIVPPAFNHLNQSVLLESLDVDALQDSLGSQFTVTIDINTSIVPPALDNIAELTPLSEAEIQAFQTALGSQIVNIDETGEFVSRSALEDQTHIWDLSETLDVVRQLDSNLDFVIPTADSRD